MWYDCHAYLDAPISIDQYCLKTNTKESVIGALSGEVFFQPGSWPYINQNSEVGCLFNNISN